MPVVQKISAVVGVLLLLTACSAPAVTPVANNVPAENTQQSYEMHLPVIANDPAPQGATLPGEPTPAESYPLQPSVEEPAAETSPESDILYSGPVTERSGEQMAPEDWQSWPVIPVVSERAREIYRWGLAHGRDPSRFSKIGDCQSIRQYFLGMYDDPEKYRLGPYSELEPAIENFSGSWFRLSESVRTGFNVASVLTSINANPENCLPNETPLNCEIRIHNPSIAIISMETWTDDRPTEQYGEYLRMIVEATIASGVVPIVSTKADNLEGDHSINYQVAQVAAEYDIPLWNFWAAADPLPNQGLMEDGFHLTNFMNHFNNEEAMQNAWPWRNLTALQAIDRVWREVSK